MYLRSYFKPQHVLQRYKRFTESTKQEFGKTDFVNVQKTYPWESCITLTDSWGWAPGQHFKSARKIIGILAEILAKGGCLALGVGPTPQGLIEDEAVSILCQIGEWLGRCGEAVYTTRITENYNDGDIWFSSSKDGK